MKKIISITSMLILFCITHLNAQTEAEMKAWQTYMTPGDVHKMMEKSAGDWIDDISMWMDPSAPPTKATTNSKNEMIMGGRYLVSKSTGDIMGMPFEGMSLMGYDNAKKIFTSTWVDNFGTGTITMTGTWDDNSKSINFTGMGTDPMTGKDMKMRQVMKFVDDDTMEIQMFDNKTGTEVKSMEMKSRRKK